MATKKKTSRKKTTSKKKTQKKTKTKSKYTTVSIPTTLANKLKEKLKETGFKNLSDYVTYILREVLAEWENEEELSQDEEELIKERLRALGYL